MKIFDRLQQVLGIDLQDRTNTLSINFATHAASRVYTLDDVGAGASFVMTAGNQTLGGNKTFTSGIAAPTVAISNAGFKYTLGVAALGNNHTIIFPDADGLAGQVLVNDGAGNLSWTTHPATAIVTDTTNFNGVLTASETSVQKALDKIDDLLASTSTKGFLSSTDWNTFYNKQATVSISGTPNGLAINSAVLSIGLSSAIATGALSSTDWDTFNNKQATLSISGTANGLALNTNVLSIGLSSAIATGALSSTDWGTFNNKQATLSISGTANGLALNTNVLSIGLSSAIATGALSSADWGTFNTAYSERRQWDGSSTNLVAATGRSSLGLGSAAQLTAGVAANNAVQLDGSAFLPAVNGSALTNLTATNVGGFTQGSVAFAGGTGFLAQDNANFFWDAANHRLGIGTPTPAAPLSVGSTSQFNVGSTGIVTVGTTVRGSAAAAGNLVLSSTSHGTKGRVYLGAIAPYATFVDEATGNMGVLVSSAPTAQLHLGGGGSAPGSACLKMTSNALLSTPEAGAWEFKGDDLYFTISTGAARKAIPFIDSISLKTKRIPFGGSAGLMDDGNLQYNQTTKGLDARRVAVGQFIESMSYGNTISSGARSYLGYVTVTASSGLMTGTPGNMVDGITSTVQTEYFNGGAVGPTTYMRFDFGSGSSQIVTEAKWYQQGSQTHGVWQWQGSNDATTWTNIGAAFTWGGAITSTQTTLSANTTGYRYYQLLGVSGTTSGAPYIYEMEFQSQNNLPPAMFPNSYFSAFDIVPSYIETVIKNGSNGATASADVMASNDFGTENTHFIDMGMNSSGWSDPTWTVCGANDGYLYTTGLLAVGTNTVGKDVVLFTGGTLAANVRLRVDGTTGNVGVGTGSAAASSTLDVLGTARFGDHATNYTDFEADGTLHMTGAATVWNDVFMSGLATRGGASAPTFAAFSGGVYGYRFDDGSVAQEVHGSMELQHDYKEGTAISVHVHWSPTTTNTGNIRWGLEYSIVNTGSAFPTTSTIYITQAGAGVVNQHQLVAFADISGTGRKIEDVIAFRLFRDANNAADTFTGNAFMHQIGIHYECDTLGSRAITTK